MATFFGEILPVGSRAVEDDEDDDGFPSYYTNCKLFWKTDRKGNRDDKKLECSLMIIAADEASCSFVESYIINEDFETIGGVYTGVDDEDAEKLHAKGSKDKFTSIHRLKKHPEILVCQCHTRVQAEQSYNWVDVVFSTIDCSNCDIIVLSSAVTCDYKTRISLSEIKAPFLRCLSTESCKIKPSCQVLEQPNIVSGLPAQVLTYCQINAISAVLFVTYTDVINVDLPTIKSFLPILKLSALKEVQINKDAEKKLSQILKQNQSNSLLYL